EVREGIVARDLEPGVEVLLRLSQNVELRGRRLSVERQPMERLVEDDPAELAVDGEVHLAERIIRFLRRASDREHLPKEPHRLRWRASPQMDAAVPFERTRAIERFRTVPGRDRLVVRLRVREELEPLRLRDAGSALPKLEIEVAA